MIHLLIPAVGVVIAGVGLSLAMRREKVPQHVIIDALKPEPPPPAATGARGMPATPGGGAVRVDVGPASIETNAVVTTRDPSPEGDLIVRSAPRADAPQIGGVDKDGVVTIHNGNAAGDNVWAEISWTGGEHPPVRGFARKAFLVLLPPVSFEV